MNQNEYLAHYGIRGMKWGVRRYQNADGTYTREGLRRYGESEKSYKEQLSKVNAAKKKLKDSDASLKESYRSELQKEKTELKNRKKQLESDYKQLKKDVSADKGRELYRQGKTITTNDVKKNRIAVGSFLVSSAALSVGRSIASRYMHRDLANLSASAVSAGSTIVAGMMIAKKNKENRTMRSYIYRTPHSKAKAK